MKNRVLFLYLLFLVILIPGCPVPGSGEGKVTSPPDNQPPASVDTPISPAAPENVTALSVNPGLVKQITISWDAVDECDYYKVYKKIGINGYVSIEDSNTSNTSYTLKETEYSQTVYYAVSAVEGGVESGISTKSNPVELTLEEVMTAIKPCVTSFITGREEKSGININWEGDPNADGYKLFRAPSPGGIYAEIFTTGDEFSNFDSDVTLGEFYYYKLCYFKDGVNYDLSEYSFGVASVYEIDIYENNNIREKSQKLTAGSLYEANIFYYEDDMNNLLIDYDWYHITVPPGHEKVISVFIPAEDLEENLTLLIEGEDPVVLSDFDSYRLTNAGGDALDIYFKFALDISKVKNIFSSYKIEVGT